MKQKWHHTSVTPAFAQDIQHRLLLRWLRHLIGFLHVEDNQCECVLGSPRCSIKGNGDYQNATLVKRIYFAESTLIPEHALADFRSRLAVLLLLFKQGLRAEGSYTGQPY